MKSKLSNLEEDTGSNKKWPDTRLSLSEIVKSPDCADPKANERDKDCSNQASDPSFGHRFFKLFDTIHPSLAPFSPRG